MLWDSWRLKCFVCPLSGSGARYSLHSLLSSSGEILVVP